MAVVSRLDQAEDGFIVRIHLFAVDRDGSVRVELSASSAGMVF